MTGDHPERQPLATPSRDLVGQALPARQEPPCPRPAPLPPTGPVGTQDRGTRLAAGRDAVMDRAWPIVVHYAPGHKRVRYSLVTDR
ncbi:hypothetical protein EBF04_21285 [Streptomyces sp. I6]|nr:hypothetical protein EBF04_21285 [Streptomyces sp. I6]